MAEKRPTPVKPLTIYFYHTRLTRESYEEWKDYKFPGHILYGLPLLEKYGIRFCAAKSHTKYSTVHLSVDWS